MDEFDSLFGHQFNVYISMKTHGYDAYIETLKSGQNVSFREKGNSMVPLIYSNQKNTQDLINIFGQFRLKKKEYNV